MNIKPVSFTIEEIQSFSNYHDLLFKKDQEIKQFVYEFEQLVKKIGFYRFLKYTEKENSKEIVICGYLKIVMKNDCKLFEFYKKNIFTLRWVKQSLRYNRKKYSIFKDSVFNFFSPRYGYNYLTVVYNLILDQIKKEYLEKNNLKLLINKVNTKYKFLLELDKSVNYNLIEQYSYYYDDRYYDPSFTDYSLVKRIKGILKNQTKGENKWRPLYLSYHKAIWKMIDRSVFALMARLYTPSAMDFYNYNYVASNLSHLERINKENYNLLPLLCYIDPKSYANLECFSYDNWVSKKTRKIKTSLKVISKANFKWLKKQKFMVVRYYSYINNPEIINFIPRDKTLSIPVFIYKRFFSMLDDFTRNQDLTSPIADSMLKIFVKCWFQYISELYKQQGFYELKSRGDFLKNEFRDALDYLKYCIEETILTIDKNASWQSIIRQSDDWHDSIIDRELQGKSKEWDELYKKIIIDNVEITPLNSTKKLYEEGKLMKHCVSTYASYCLNGKYRVFHLELLENNNVYNMATLGVKFLNNKWHIDQLQSYCNDSPIDILGNVTKKFIKKINNIKVKQ